MFDPEHHIIPDNHGAVLVTREPLGNAPSQKNTINVVVCWEWPDTEEAGRDSTCYSAFQRNRVCWRAWENSSG